MLCTITRQAREPVLIDRDREKKIAKLIQEGANLKKSIALFVFFGRNFGGSL